MPSTAGRSSSASTVPATLVNGVRRSVAGVAEHLTALDWLRGLGLTATRSGCGAGWCGACTVLLARPHHPDPSVTEWTAVASCLVPAIALAGEEVVTAEGLDPAGGPPRVGGCGFCAAGFACALAAARYRGATDARALDGDRCPCRRDRRVLATAQALGPPADDDPVAARRAEPPPTPGAVRTDSYVRPDTLAEALGLLAADPGGLTPVAGGTGETSLRGPSGGPDGQDDAGTRLAVGRLDELRRFGVDDRRVEIGAALTVSEVERLAAPAVPLLGQVAAGFASSPVRNLATVGGSVGGPPDADLVTALLALESDVVLVGLAGDQPAERTVGLAALVAAPAGSLRRADELVAAVRVPRPTSPLTAFRRLEVAWDEHGRATHRLAVAVALDVVGSPAPTVTRVSVWLAGLAPAPVRAHAAEAALMGQVWTARTASDGGAALAAEVDASSLPDGDRETARALLTEVLSSLWPGGGDEAW